MPTTIRDIAKTLNVSHTTVSRVLNGRGGEFISEATRRRVQTAARELNYRANPAARKLATGRANMIAVWMGDPFYPYFAAVSHYVEAQLRQHNLDMLHVASNRPHHENDFSYFVDGILALDGLPEVEAFLKHASQPHPPLVSMGCNICKSLDYVWVDLGIGTRAAMTHLLESGCRRIPFLVTEWGLTSGDARRYAYQAVMQEWGCEQELIFLPEREQEVHSWRSKARARMRDYVTENGCPDGLFCFSDDLAIGAYRGLRDLGIRIPDDIALVGCDGIEDALYLDTPLSTIEQPYEAMCVEAWRLLQRRMTTPDAPLEQVILTPKLILRESSRRVAHSPQGEITLSPKDGKD